MGEICERSAKEEEKCPAGEKLTKRKGLTLYETAFYASKSRKLGINELTPF